MLNLLWNSVRGQVGSGVGALRSKKPGTASYFKIKGVVLLRLRIISDKIGMEIGSRAVRRHSRSWKCLVRPRP